jgi:predicted HicB family RNase H-like nuclease
MDEHIDIEDDLEAITKARQKMIASFSSTKKSRKDRGKKIRAAVDGRSLRATGRTEQFNIKMRPEIKQAVTAAAEASGVSVVEWVERQFEEILGLRGK